mmetsp:Transcript_29911/g.95832  ORF Transcript_29911/g.95832 Transcript_29911/m.95832 type:complete len:231 (+) Transcript_29911:780-1472(+)
MNGLLPKIDRRAERRDGDSLVRPPPMLVHLSQPVGSRKELRRVSLGRPVELPVLCLPVLEGLGEFLRGHKFPLLQPLLQVRCLRDVAGGSCHLDAVERGGQTGAIAEHEDTLALGLLFRVHLRPSLGLVPVVDEGEEACVHGGRVGVAELLREQDGRFDLGSVHGSGKLDEGLLKLLVVISVLWEQLLERLEILLVLLEDWKVGVSEEVVVEHAGPRLLDELVVRGVKHH